MIRLVLYFLPGLHLFFLSFYVWNQVPYISHLDQTGPQLKSSTPLKISSATSIIPLSPMRNLLTGSEDSKSAAKPRANSLGYQLAGTILEDNNKIAFLQNKRTRKIIRLREGAVLSGWQLKSIRGKSVTLTRNMDKHIVEKILRLQSIRARR